MTVHIDHPVNLLIFGIAVLAGYVTYKRTQPQPPLPPGPGDLTAAFTVGAITLAALAFLLGIPTS
ncbi:hypothetical protein AB0B40_31450 [Streptomyces sp. NPDC042638]|jgi:hypothetical protein|uniref:hypothetical protein n=1 Tax=Streptomyces sp. NPDC042638 TaxID=3154333 RepID=UPI0033CED96C